MSAAISPELRELVISVMVAAIVKDLRQPDAARQSEQSKVPDVRHPRRPLAVADCEDGTAFL